VVTRRHDRGSLVVGARALTRARGADGSTVMAIIVAAAHSRRVVARRRHVPRAARSAAHAVGGAAARTRPQRAARFIR
jgi:hypothetical protein